jgi:RHS repeat-associated protein
LPGCTIAQVEISLDDFVYQVTIDYSYDPLNRLIAADYDDGTFFHYSYDETGNRLTQETQEGIDTYLYDAANRLIEVNGQPYTWDNNGNLLSDGATTYTYNYANMLESVDQGGVIYTYRYNGLRDRLTQSMDGLPTTYTLDLVTGLTQVLKDSSKTYLYGNKRIVQVNGTSREYFLGDGIGSVRQLIDQTDKFTLIQSYDPFGTPIYSQGNGSTSYQYIGEYWDGTGLSYLRARYYETITGRFISKDPWNGVSTNPISYNSWIYAFDNPIRYCDPSGQIPCPPPYTYYTSCNIDDWFAFYFKDIFAAFGIETYYSFQLPDIPGLDDYNPTGTPTRVFGEGARIYGEVMNTFSEIGISLMPGGDLGFDLAQVITGTNLD